MSSDVSAASPVMIRTDVDLHERYDVLVLEAAPHFYRGGNTRHTRNMRGAHDSATEILTGPYTEDEFREDLKRVTQGHTDEELARHMIAEMLTWIVGQGCASNLRSAARRHPAAPIRSSAAAAARC
jgi:hypothetical protein